MPNDTIVQYILSVDTGKAEKGLKETSQASKQVGQSFEQVGQATTQMNQKIKKTEQQTKKTTSSFKNMRKAGRDLDGAFSDLGQGLGLINPAAGQLFMTLSSGASIAEGLGRSMLLFVNPAILGVAAVTVAAAAGLYFLNQANKDAEEKAEKLKKAFDASTESLMRQEKALEAANGGMLAYTDTLVAAQMDLDLLTGAMSSLEAATVRAKAASDSFQTGATAANEKIVSLLKGQMKDRRALLRASIKELDTFKEKITFRNKLAMQNSDEMKHKKQLVASNREEFELLREKLNSAKQKSRDIKNEASDLLDILITNAEITQEQKEQTEQDRKSAKWRAKKAREQKEQQAAAKKLQGIINKLTLGELTGREKIIEQYEQELAVIEQLEITSKDMFAAAEAELLLREKRDRLLDEELRKEKERLGTAKDMLSIVSSTVSSMRSPEAFVSGLGSIVGQVGTAGGFAGATSLSPAISAGGQAAVAVAGLGGMVQQAIDEAAKQEIPVILDEKQAERVVLGNMNEAFSNFTRDLERGLELLPEIIVRVLPDFIVSLAKVMTFDIQKMIAIDLPIAILKATPALVIAVINEIGFMLADLINGFSRALDQFTSFIQSVFTKEGRQDAVTDSIDGLKRWFETTFTGVGAVRDAVDAFAGGGSFIPQAAGGMRYTGNQRSGLAMLHQGEFVVPQSGMRPQSVDRQMNSSGGSAINIVINGTVVEQNAVDALVRRIEERFNSNFGLASSNLFGGR